MTDRIEELEAEQEKYMSEEYSLSDAFDWAHDVATKAIALAKQYRDEKKVWQRKVVRDADRFERQAALLERAKVIAIEHDAVLAQLNVEGHPLGQCSCNAISTCALHYFLAAMEES